MQSLKKILSIMKPSEFEISLKVMRSSYDTNILSEKQWLLSIERAQYAADREERSLCSQARKTGWLSIPWNPSETKNSKKCKNKTGLYHIQLQKNWITSAKKARHPKSRTKDPGNLERTSIYSKKWIIRILIDDITVLSEKRCPDFSISIRFHSGKYEQLSLKKSIPYSDRRSHSDSTVSRVQELVAAMSDFKIAGQLNQDVAYTRRKSIHICRNPLDPL